MKKALKIIGISLGALIAILIILALYVNFNTPTYEIKKVAVNIPSPDSSTLAHGKRLTALMCAGCHLNNGTLEGKKMMEIPAMFGDIYAQNISSHPTKGIGRYTDEELVYFLRTGVKRNGEYSFIMSGHPLMSDRDLNAIIAFLRSDDPMMTASEKTQYPTKPSFFVKLLSNFVFKPHPFPEKEIITPPKSNQLAYGKYLADDLLGCFGCHSADFTKVDPMVPENTPGFYAGGSTILDPNDQSPVLSSNLTPHETGLKGWTLEQFSDAVKFGKRPDGNFMTAAMPPRPQLTDEELAAIWSYLQTIPAIDNEVVQARAQ